MPVLRGPASAAALLAAGCVVAALQANPARAAGPLVLPAMVPLLAANFADVAGLVLVPALGPIVTPTPIALVDADNTVGVIVPLSSDVTSTAYAGPESGAEIDNNGSIANTGTATTTQNSGGFIVNINTLFGTVDAGVTANADITGIELGSGGVNYLTNDGPVSATANATVSSGDVQINLIELAAVDANVLATAIATGLAGGAMRDVILNDAAVTALATATASHFSGELNILNTTSGEMNVAAQSTAVGIDGRGGDDIIINNLGNTITATASSTSSLTTVNLTIGDASITDLSVFEASGDTAPISEARAVGIDGGGRADVLINSGTIAASATVEVDSFGLGVTGFGVTDAGTIAGIFSDEPQVDGETAARATAIGMEGGAGADRLANTGTITATATSEADSTGVTVAMPVPNLPIPLSFLPGFNIVGVGTGDEATAYGMSGGAGADFIGNEGNVTATATSDSLAVSVAIELPDLLSAESDDPTISTSFSVTDAATISTAVASALFGGGANDTLTNFAGTLTAAATSKSQTTAVNVIVTEGGTGFTGRLNAARTSVLSTATATGMDGGDRNDTMANSGGPIDVDADADADNVSVTASVIYADDPGSVLISVSGIDSETEATATAVGMNGGAGTDGLQNDNTIDADAVSNADAVVVSVALTFNKDVGLAAGVQLLNTDATAHASSEGVSGGGGVDTIVNTSTVDADATATSNATVTTLSLTGSWAAGAAIGVSVADTSANADATATGLAGGDGADTITNSGALGVNAVSSASALTLAATVAATKDAGLAAGASVLRAGAFADSTGYGIAGGAGADTVVNTGDLTARAQADSFGLGVALTATFAKTGAALGVSLVDAQTISTALAAGIFGDIEDRIESSGALDVDAIANATSTSVSTSFSFADKGIAAGASLAKSGATAEATATGIVGGGLDDVLTASGISDVDATATTVSTGVGVSVAGTNTGVAIGFSMVDAAARSTSTSIGLAGNMGEDTLANTGTLDSMATATTNSTGVSVSLAGSNTGVSIGVALADTSAIAEAIAKGLFGGWGDDIISSSDTLTAMANATATGVTASMSLSFAATGVAAGASMAKASADASALAVGIDGGHGRDTIVTTGTIDADADATATNISVSMAISASVQGASAAAAFADVGVTGEATATGIAGGDEAGDASEPGDDILNKAVVVADATSEVTGVAIGFSASVSFVPLGFSHVKAATNSTATATGIDGGLGADLIDNRDTVTAKALAKALANATSISIAAGAAIGNASANANAFATGIDGGGGQRPNFE